MKVAIELQVTRYAPFWNDEFSISEMATSRQLGVKAPDCLTSCADCRRHVRGACSIAPADLVKERANPLQDTSDRVS